MLPWKLKDNMDYWGLYCKIGVHESIQIQNKQKTDISAKSLAILISVIQTIKIASHLILWGLCDSSPHIELNEELHKHSISNSVFKIKLVERKLPKP